MRWERVSERKEKHPETKQLLRQKKKQNKTKQNKVRWGGKQTAVAAEGRNRSWKSGSRRKKRRKKFVRKKDFDKTEEDQGREGPSGRPVGGSPVLESANLQLFQISKLIWMAKTLLAQEVT